MSEFEDHGERFAGELTDVFVAVIDESISFESVATPGSPFVKVGPAPFRVGPGFAMVPLWRTCDDRGSGGPPPLQLRVEYSLEMDRERAFPQVSRSTFGLWVAPTRDRLPRPLFRIEYDRYKTRKPAAHVHFHAESADLAWIYGSSGQQIPPFEEVHFPVGGRRFRPTIEEVLLALRQERVFTDWRPGAARAIRHSLDKWDTRQAGATVRVHPEVAAAELERRGWKVTPPPA